MQNRLLRLALAIILGASLSSCITPSAVEPAKPGDPAQQQQRAWLIGT